MSGPRRLPPLNSLRVFHALARNRTIRATSEELFVTPQAVGQQVRLLEEALGVPLVEKIGKAMRLTDEAITLAHYVNSGFEEFENGVRHITAKGERARININVTPYFATHYLVPRLASFDLICPDARIRLTTIVDPSDISVRDFDISIQWCCPDQVTASVVQLLKDPKVICCAPNIAKEIAGPADLLKHKLLQLVRGPGLWPDILEHLGTATQVSQEGLGCDDAATMRLAARQGLGIGLLSKLDAENDIAEGRLAAPLGIDALSALPDSKVPGFYLIASKSKLKAPFVAALYRWLQKEQW